jgi:hypothetical protein
MRSGTRILISLAAGCAILGMAVFGLSEIYAPITGNELPSVGSAQVTQVDARDVCRGYYDTLKNLERQISLDSTCMIDNDCQFVGCGVPVSKIAWSAVASEAESLRETQQECRMMDICDFELTNSVPICVDRKCAVGRQSTWTFR